MKIVKASFEITTPPFGDWTLLNIERAARGCTQTAMGDTKRIVSGIVRRRETGALEHGGVVSVRFVVNRGVTHELVRYRINPMDPPLPRNPISFMQESTRRCNYSASRFNGELTFVDPRGAFEIHAWQFRRWIEAKQRTEIDYFDLLRAGLPVDMTRGSLDHDVKAEITVTTNPVGWRHMLSQRTDVAAHPQMHEVMRPLLREFRAHCPVLFDDVGVIA